MERDVVVYLYLKHWFDILPIGNQDSIIEMLEKEYDLKFSKHPERRQWEVNNILSKRCPTQLLVRQMKNWIGFSNNRIAQVLSITKPAVSYHLNSKNTRGYSNPHVRNVTRVWKEAEERSTQHLIITTPR